MLSFIYGTTAELIKIAPVLRELDKRKIKYTSWCTTQHSQQTIKSVAKQLQVAPPDRWIVTSPTACPLTSNRKTPHWLAHCFKYLFKHRKELIAQLNRDHKPPLILVHGDTFTTVIGSLYGKVLKARVAHIEAGMRSRSFFSPFPEEINRTVTAHLADLHFAPTQVEANNLRQIKGAVVVTQANTAIDSLRWATEQAEKPKDTPPKYCLLTLHRFELINAKNSFVEIVKTMKEHSKQVPVLWVMGDTETAKAKELGLDKLFDDHFIPLEKRSYQDFLPYVLYADHIVTDSGGLQQESIYLGKPLAVHRNSTESYRDRAGKDYVLTKLSIPTLKQFLADPDRWRQQSTVDRAFPSKTIVHALEALGY